MLHYQTNQQMKNIYAFLLLSFSLANAQETEVVKWINSNAIIIEDTNPDTSLDNFKKHTPNIFKDVKLFGFGEATHYTKEFFNLKAKFFKYLVENEGVTLFIMEESFGHADDINDYLKGGNGTADQLTGTLGFGVWRNQEVAGLISWIKTYNQDKPETKQVKFYGMDNQFGYKTNEVVKQFITKYSINTPEKTAALLDSCANADARFINKSILKNYLKQLDNITADLKNNFTPSNTTQFKDYDHAAYALTILKQYIAFELNHSYKERDKAMAENAIYLMQHQGKDVKGFIWAHNGHIDKKGIWQAHSTGYHLKKEFGDTYYSMGFDFATGQLYTKTKEGKIYKGGLHTISEPLKDTYADVFTEADAPVFIIDFKAAQKDIIMKDFLKSNRKIITTGGGGYNPLYKGSKENLLELYDGILFVRDISHATYMEERLPESMRVLTKP